MKGRPIAEIFKFLKRALTEKIFIKLLSVFLALIIWSYIINNNTTLTRAKHIEGLDVSVSGTSSLNNHGLALSTDVFSAYENSVEVVLDISQKEFYRAKTDSVYVYADVSNIRSAGIHEVPLTASSPTGTVKSIYPSSILLRVEGLDTRVVPIEIDLVGTPLEDYWYSVDDFSLNPGEITISGPASVVQMTDRVFAQVDITGHTETFPRAALLSAQDSKGEVINNRLLSRSTSTCSVTVNVYPTKEIPLTCDASQIKVAEGYEISEISFQPPVITVAGDEKLLSSMESLPVEAPTITKPLEKTTVRRIDVAGLDEFKYTSTRQVMMNITIRAAQTTKTLTEGPKQVFSVRKCYESGLS